MNQRQQRKQNSDFWGTKNALDSIAGQRKKNIKQKCTSPVLVPQSVTSKQLTLAEKQQLEICWAERLQVFWDFYVDSTSDIKRYKMAQICSSQVAEEDIRKWIMVSTSMRRWEDRNADKVLRNRDKPLLTF